MEDEETASKDPPGSEAASQSSERDAASKRRFRISLATLVALMTLATGALTLRDQLFPGDGEVPVDPAIQRFDGVVGHLAESRALIGFMEQNDGQVVQLDVGFPVLAGSDDYIGDPGSVTYVQVFTECTPDPPPGEEPDFAKGCLATSLELGPETEASGGFLEHGVPVIQGYFEVDVTGALHQGVSPIRLRPLTFEEATAR